ncbi:MAG: double-stranded RNA binding motif domain-containing protein [Prolixibacteraceae bacterium]|jgi:hypothetical protein|nr:double-stranded RNA binding motif domain-containing protein [Prolixibacteraceae bacterium]
MKEKIKELFSMLPRAEQLELLRELTSSTEIQNPVIRVNEISQVQFGQNISFTVSNIGTDGEPSIKVVLTSPWGNFVATAINQKIAKAQAAEMAILNLNEQLENG